MSIVTVIKCEKELARLRAAMTFLQDAIPKLEKAIAEYRQHLYSNEPAMPQGGEVTDLTNGGRRGNAHHFSVHGAGEQPELEMHARWIASCATGLEALQGSVAWLLRLFYWAPIDQTRCEFCQMTGGHALDCFRDRCERSE